MWVGVSVGGPRGRFAYPLLGPNMTKFVPKNHVGQSRSDGAELLCRVSPGPLGKASKCGRDHGGLVIARPRKNDPPRR